MIRYLQKLATQRWDVIRSHFDVGIVKSLEHVKNFCSEHILKSTCCVYGAAHYAVFLPQHMTVLSLRFDLSICQ